MLASCALALRIWRMISNSNKLELFCLQIAGALLVVAGVVTAAWPSQGASVFTEVSNVMTENSLQIELRQLEAATICMHHYCLRGQCH